MRQKAALVAATSGRGSPLSRVQDRYPAELSDGTQRAAIARTLTLSPGAVRRPTTGLTRCRPATRQLIRELADQLHVTCVVVSTT
jgi:ABC-type transporter Mla maintaining outer membrane lipid asymmetry ATPase subunit MlaF